MKVLCCFELNSNSGDYYSVGELIKIYRINKKLTQTDFAKILGVTKNMISLWETDQSNPGLYHFFELVELGVIGNPSNFRYFNSTK